MKVRRCGERVGEMQAAVKLSVVEDRIYEHGDLKFVGSAMSWCN